MATIGNFKVSGTLSLKIEQENLNAPFGPWFDGMMRHVPVSVVMAGAGLEACANEIMGDILDGTVGVSIDGSRRTLLNDLKSDRSGNATDRYRRLALLMDHEPDTSTEVWHNTRLLIRFRNDFMHFKPSWDHDDVHSGDLVSQLKTRIPVVNAYQGSFLFPFGFMTYGCAKWAVQSLLAFSSQFATLIGVRDKLAMPGLDCKIP
ncbi:MAG: hypothetical protein JO166_17120 [Deltaproteobacteria bacterium]|nr:hypothetical protein [Deltaproteobacteria bacterium]